MSDTDSSRWLLPHGGAGTSVCYRPEVWSGIGNDWQMFAREQQAGSDPSTARLDAIDADLGAALKTQPPVFWHFETLAVAVAHRHHVQLGLVRRMMRDHPDAASPDAGTWCAAAAAPQWAAAKTAVCNAIPPDKALTIDELATAAGLDHQSLHCVLWALHHERRIAALQDADEATRFALARPSNDYSDLRPRSRFSRSLAASLSTAVGHEE
jgi:hypothetical protein